MLSSSIASILRSSAQLAEPIHVAGCSTPASALVTVRLAEFMRDQSSPIVVLCANDDVASELSGDLETLASIVDETRLKIFHFPTWEQSPYSPIALSLRTRLARLEVLSELLKKERPQILVTSIAAASQATLPADFFREVSIPVRLNTSVGSREQLIARLVAAGYLKSDPVEDPGNFAFRGDIVDVFPPDRQKPLRIELFGDVVERIRDFDPATQRALSEVKADGKSPILEVIIPPAREILIQAATTSILRENLKARADDLGISRAARDPVLTSISDGTHPDHSESWAPFAYRTPATLWDYLGETWMVVWNDELSCRQEWGKFLAEQVKLSAEATHSEMISPAVNALFAWTPALENQVKEHSKIYLNRIELATLATVEANQAETPQDQEIEKNLKRKPATAVSTRHEVSVQSNRDLARGGQHSLTELEPQFRQWNKQGFRTLILASTQSQLERIRFLLDERDLYSQQTGPLIPSLIKLSMGTLSEGFRWPTEGLVVLTEEEILGAQHVKKQRRASHSESGSAAKNWSGLQALSDLGIGDFVVHVDHGIGKYQGIVRLDLSGAPNDFLLLEFANKDKLYLPIYRLNVIQKYVGAGEGVALDRLGSQQFAKTKDKVRENVKKLAFDLIQLYAQRKIQAGIQFSPRDATYREFEAQFPFDETPDQLKAIDSILSDMESGRVMDRLVCGDVGYGKTEVAIRAAFRAVSDGKQVAVLVPTTILAQQHEQSFKTRLKDYPLIIESISRFKSPKQQKALIEAVEKGRVDIIIGTHRLLSKDIRFHDLGIIIVDEEHRFGVEHKERLKTLKLNCHVLTLTATPIPRTLHMALSGLRDISLINTPPVNRLPIRTYVSKYDESLIQRGIEFELSRGGQVFFLHNRVQTIYKTANRLRELVPGAQVIVAHGQMNEHELEEAMITFYQKRANVMVCTTIIESGLDLPSANTIMINRADSLGLAQLYQIRGRVGRGQQRAYAYLFIPEEGALSEDAKRRLEVIQKFVELGSGFSIASHDLEIRGGGDLLGPQQSGSIAAVGFDLYTELLEEAIQEMQGKPIAAEESRREPEIKAPFPSFLGEDFIPDVHQRLSFYRRFSAAATDAEVNQLEEELRDRFGSLPVEAQNLMWLIRIKILLKNIGIDSLTVGSEKVSLLPGPQSKLDPTRAIALVSAYPHQYQLRPDSKIVAKISTGTLRDLFFELEVLFKKFSLN